MSVNSPNATNDHVPNALNKWAPYVTAGITVVGVVVTYLGRQSDDMAFWLGSVLSVLMLIGFGLFFWFAKVPSNIRMSASSDQTFRIHRFSKGLAKGAWGAAGVLLVFAAIVRFGFRDELFELATIDRCGGNALIMDEGKEKFREGIVCRLPVQGDALAYPAVTIIVAHKGTGRVIIDEVKLLVEPMDDQEARPVATSVLPDNETMPNLYVAKLTREIAVSEVKLFRAGNLTDGFSYVEEAKPFAKLHIGLDGQQGLYRVQVELTVKNGNRAQVIRSEQRVFVIPQRQ